MDLSPHSRREFLDRGYIVVPCVVPEHVLTSARDAIDEHLLQNPPDAMARGKHFLWINRERRLRALLHDTPAFELAASLVAPRKLAVTTPAAIFRQTPDARSTCACDAPRTATFGRNVFGTSGTNSVRERDRMMS
jgi:hypothetical protein